jgi:hypothetical protein
MKGKLVKRSNGRFDLYKIEDVDQLNTIASSFDNPIGKLSLKKCQAIELGYDLDDLAKKEYLDGYDTTEMCRAAFKDGFKKAIELMDDKKFSEDDVILISEYVRVASQSTPNVRTKDLFDEYQSLQQTEWDVEIVMEYQGFEEDGKLREAYLPKLDEDGCLILKRL